MSARGATLLQGINLIPCNKVAPLLQQRVIKIIFCNWRLYLSRSRSYILCKTSKRPQHSFLMKKALVALQVCQVSTHCLYCHISGWTEKSSIFVDDSSSLQKWFSIGTATSMHANAYCRTSNYLWGRWLLNLEKTLNAPQPSLCSIICRGVIQPPAHQLTNTSTCQKYRCCTLSVRLAKLLQNSHDIAWIMLNDRRTQFRRSSFTTNDRNEQPLPFALKWTHWREWGTNKCCVLGKRMSYFM